MKAFLTLNRLRPTTRMALFGVAVLLACRTCFAAEPKAEQGMIDSCQHSSDPEARAVWLPMEGSAPVSISTIEGRNALRMPCNFAGTRIQRASWDRRVQLDMTACQGIEFQLLCRDATPVSYFSLYLQSGAGWYHGTFYPESAVGWNTIRLDKAAFGTEGEPAGWSQIGAIRISAWRGQDKDTEMCLRDLRLRGALGHEALVAILRAESVARQRPEEARSVNQFAETAAQMLRSAGVGCAVVSDSDATLPRLQGARLVILPHNPTLPERAADVLARYVEGGGKLLVFYTVPDRLRGLLNVTIGAHVRESRPGSFAMIRLREGELPGAPRLTRQRSWNIHAVQPIPGAGRVLAEWLDDQGSVTGYPAIVGSSNGLVMTHVPLTDDPANKARLMLAMAGSLVPELWRRAADASLGQAGVIGPAGNLAEAAALIRQQAANHPRAIASLGAAQQQQDTAQEMLRQGRYAEAIDTARAAQESLTKAWCLAQSPLPGEFRAFWCHSAFGVQGMTWEAAVARLADNGFTAILPNMLWGGAAFYPSKTLPSAAEAERRGDQIAQCLAAARKHGLQAHIWKVNWNLGHAAPKEFAQQMRREGRLQVGAQGKEEPWLCPSHPENQKLEIVSMLEVARNYDVDGLHFDYIRYPDADHCFCQGCKERFSRATHSLFPNWPKEVRTEGDLRQQWLEWRRGNITAVVRAVAERARAIRPRIKISAAVFRNWATDRDGVGQDWKLWCERGWLDFVCPMDYTESPREFENMVVRQVEWAGRVPCYPGIGESASSSRLGVDRVIELIQLTRRHRTGGFVIFNYAVPEAEELLPLLGMGITAPAR